MENEGLKRRVFQTVVTRVLDRVWERLLEGGCVNEFVEDTFRLQRNRQVVEVSVLADSLKVLLLSVRISTWRQLVMAIRIWEGEIGLQGRESSIWEAERQILGPVAELLNGGEIRLDDAVSAQTLAESIAERGDDIFVDASEETWASLDAHALGTEEMAAWMESSDWDVYREIRQKDAYIQSRVLAGLCQNA